MPNVREAMIRRTKMFFKEKQKFLELLHKDLSNLEKHSNACCRLNVASDLPWEKIDSKLFDYDITFYDYTKNEERMNEYIRNSLPKNYHLTYSFSETSDKRQVNRFLKNGGNVALIVNHRYNYRELSKLPPSIKIATKTWNVRDGDLSDIRTPKNDGTGNIIAIRAKMKKSIIKNYVDKNLIVKV